MHNCAAGAYNPTVFVIDEVDVDQFASRGCLQDFPGIAAILSESENTVYDVVAAAGGTHHPTSFLAVKAEAI